VRVTFGDFVVDDDSRQVWRRDAVLHVSPKAFDLLATLIRERPRALSKADLHARIWPQTFVSDASLAMLVAELRAALGENARQPTWVRTVHRHGYAFQGVALEVPTAGAPLHGAAQGYWLVTSSGQVALAPGDNIIGRDPSARVWLDSPSVSRRHACIRIDGDSVTVLDLDSKNGTRLKDADVCAAMPLEDGDPVRFGSVEATFRCWSSDPTRTEGDAL